MPQTSAFCISQDPGRFLSLQAIIPPATSYLDSLPSPLFFEFSRKHTFIIALPF